MPRITGFSPEAVRAVRQYYAVHPLVELRIVRAGDPASLPVKIRGLRCEDCGWHVERGKVFDTFMATLKQGLDSHGEELPRGHLPSDFLAAFEWTHAWKLPRRDAYCGGRLVMDT